MGIWISSALQIDRKLKKRIFVSKFFVDIFIDFNWVNNNNYYNKKDRNYQHNKLNPTI